jgi:opacity protein-like surface antigen
MIGAKAALKLGRLTPFVSARGEFDFSKSNEVTVATDQQTADGGDFGLRFTAGADVALTQGLSLYVEGSTVQLRDDYSEYSGALRIRAEF